MRAILQIARRRMACALCLVLALLACASTSLFAQDDSAASVQFREASQAMRNGDLKAAGEGFEAAAKAAPTFAEAHFNLGLVREEQGRFDESIASLQRALNLKPRLRGANLFLGIANYRLNRFVPALAAVTKEAQAYPKDASAWMWQGVIDLAMDKPEDAAVALDKAASLAPDNVDILYHRGQAHLLVSKNSYGEMFKRDPNSWRVHQVIAQANIEAERYLDAVAEYETAVKLAPTQPGLHEELGSAYRDAGRSPEAEAAFQRELEIDPYNVLARYKLGVLAIERGDGARAKELIEAALKEKPGLRHSEYNLGRAEMLLGQDENALKYLQTATSTETDPEVLQESWYQLGIVLRRLHRMKEAQQAIATFQRLKDEQAERSQEQLKKFKVRQDAEVAQPASENQ